MLFASLRCDATLSSHPAYNLPTCVINVHLPPYCLRPYEIFLPRGTKSYHRSSLTNELNVLDDKDRKINGHQTCDIEYFLDCEPLRTRLSDITTSFPKDPRASEKWKQRWKL